ncbi:MAG: hypothetical protein QXJ28_00315 [Candidatus Pacearchaeota archaeon]
MIKRVIAPVRIDFGGGTTDIFPFTRDFGGAVLNAAINKYIHGKLIATDKQVKLSYYGDLPTSSGLGTSGVMNLVWLALISNKKNKEELAEEVYKIEQVMGLIGGKQDQYAAAFGGINFIEVTDKVKVTKLKLSKKIIKEMENRLVIVYTGKPHFSGNSNKKSIDNLVRGNNIENLKKIKEIAIEMKEALLEENLNKFSNLLNEETKYRSRLHKTMVPGYVKKFIEEGLKNGAESAKILGSGNGGSILFFGDKKKIIRKFGKRAISFKFDFQGLREIRE